MSILISAGRLISTSDMKLARKLQSIVSVEEITGGETPRHLRQYHGTLSFMFGGEFYELEATR